MKSNVAQIVAAGGNVILNAFLIPRLQAVGAVIASVCAEVLIMSIYFWQVRKEYQFRNVLRVGWKKFMSAVVMFAVIFFLDRQLSSSIIHSFMEVGIGSVIYGVGLLLLRDEFALKIWRSVLAKVRGKKV